MKDNQKVLKDEEVEEVSGGLKGISVSNDSAGDKRDPAFVASINIKDGLNLDLNSLKKDD